MGANFNFNKTFLGGRITNDVELKETVSGASVCKFTIAVNRDFKNANGEYETDFIDCVAWRDTAEFISKYFRKGSAILVEGSIQKRQWEDDEGKKRYATEIVVSNARFVESKDESAPAPSKKKPSVKEITTDDDIPF